VLRGEGLPTVYVSGDNASVEVVRAIAAAHGPIDAAVLFAGNAQVPERWGADVPLTLTPEAAVAAARILDPAVVVPIHQDGWAHFTSGPEELEEAFAAAGLAGRLRTVAPGGVVGLT